MLQIQQRLLAIGQHALQQWKCRFKILSPKTGLVNGKRIKNPMPDVYPLRKFCHFPLSLFVHLEG